MNSPVLINDYLTPLHRLKKLKVFLCGRRPENKHFDLRLQLKKVLQNQMGCTPFLGEDISELKKLKPSADYLTIEVKEAQQSDLIIIFLGAPGTIAELTAFALDKTINKRLIVFNEKRHVNSTSFINLGPMKLLPKERVFYYDNKDNAMTPELKGHMDKLVSAIHFERHPQYFKPGSDLMSFFLMAEVIARNPVRPVELESCFPWSEVNYRTILKTLFESGLVKKKLDCIIPAISIREFPLHRSILSNIQNTRMRLHNVRLKDVEKKRDYYLILS